MSVNEVDHYNFVYVPLETKSETFFLSIWYEVFNASLCQQLNSLDAIF